MRHLIEAKKLFDTVEIPEYIDEALSRNVYTGYINDHDKQVMGINIAYHEAKKGIDHALKLLHRYKCLYVHPLEKINTVVQKTNNCWGQCKRAIYPEIGRGGLPYKNNQLRTVPFKAVQLNEEAFEHLHKVKEPLYRVLHSFPINATIKKAAYQMGTYASRDLKYMFPIYESKSLCICGKETHEQYFFIDNNKVIGSILMSKSNYSQISSDDWEDVWILCYVWILPEYRNTGLLSQAWPNLVKRYSPFIIQNPISDPLSKFASSRQQHTLSILNKDCELMIPIY